ncbi:MAG: Ig-like domain-containing protein, partial [Ruminococcus sp.]|nr:Ig-like domain-containing protein [Ruminococcus sp.]
YNPEQTEATQPTDDTDAWITQPTEATGQTVDTSATIEPVTQPTQSTMYTQPTQSTQSTQSTQATQATEQTEPQQTQGTYATEATQPTEKPTGHTQPTVVRPTQPTEPSYTYPVIETLPGTSHTEGLIELNLKSATVKCGKIISLRVKNIGNKKAKFSSSNSNIAKVSSKGKVSALKKGFAKITVRVGVEKLYFTIKVTTSPKLSKSSVKVKKGGYTTVKVIGKVSTVKNVYISTKKAKITSKRTAKTLRIKGLKKGTTTLKIKVNKVLLKLRVKVE